MLSVSDLYTPGFFKQTIVLNLDKLNVDGISFCDTQVIFISNNVFQMSLDVSL